MARSWRNFFRRDGEDAEGSGVATEARPGERTDRGVPGRGPRPRRLAVAGPSRGLIEEV